MLTTRIIPCLDIKDGRVVKGVQFGNLVDAGSPLDLAEQYQEQGADELIILDIAATPAEKAHRADVVTEIRRRLAIPVTVGGGVRTMADVVTLLTAGADKVAVNTAAVKRPALIGEIAERFGRQCTVVAIDARSYGDTFEVMTMSGRKRTGINAIRWARQAVACGAGEILLTSWDRDGSRAGYDIALIKEVSQAVPVPIIASGGAASPGDMVAAIEAGAAAVLAASIFHFGTFSVSDVKTVLENNGIEVRL